MCKGIELFNTVDGDCFVGGLVACGIGPQMSGVTTPATIARTKYWLDLYKTHGKATESTITALLYPNIFLVGLENGTNAIHGTSYGLYTPASAVRA